MLPRILLRGPVLAGGGSGLLGSGHRLGVLRPLQMPPGRGETWPCWGGAAGGRGGAKGAARRRGTGGLALWHLHVFRLCVQNILLQVPLWREGGSPLTRSWLPSTERGGDPSVLLPCLAWTRDPRSPALPRGSSAAQGR